MEKNRRSWTEITRVQFQDKDDQQTFHTVQHNAKELTSTNGPKRHLAIFINKMRAFETKFILEPVHALAVVGQILENTTGKYKKS